MKVYKTICIIAIAITVLCVALPCNGQLMSGEWTKFRGNIRNTGLSTAAGPSSADVEWTFETGAAISSSPAIATDGTVYIVSQDQKLHAINPDGSVKWQYNVNSRSYSSPAIASDGTIYVGSDDYYLYAINPNGTLKWRKYVGKEIKSSPTVGSDGTVYVGVMNSKLYAISSSGNTRWTETVGNPIVSSPAIGPNGNIYFGSEDGYLYAVDSAGVRRWRFRTSYWVDSSPAVSSDGNIYVGNSNGRLYAISPNGGLLWFYNIGSAIKSSPAIGPDGTIYVGSDDNYLYALTSTGSLKWRYATGDRVQSSPSVGSDGTVYFGSFDNYLYALNPDGTLLWRHGLGGSQVFGSPAIASDGSLYIGSSDKKLYKFCCDDTPPTTPVVVDDGIFTTSPDSLHAVWTSSDSQSGISEYQYAIGTTAGSDDIVGWTSTGATAEVTRTGLSLVNGGAYYFAVRAKNRVGLWSDIGVSDGIIVDFTPPSLPVVTDDGQYTTSNNTLHGSWASSDLESGVTEYQYCIGTTSGGSNIRGWMSVGTSTEVTATGLSLTEGVTYYISVKARNGADMWSSIGSSDGITTDFSPPTTPVVTDDGDYTSSTNSLHAAWSSSDPHSGVAEYQYCIGTTSGGSNIRGWTSVGISAEVTATGLSLTEGVTYYISVKARNGAGMWSSVGSSNGITTDFSPPATPVVTDDGDYTSSTDSLHAAWSSSDPHSGVAEYQYCIGTTSGGSNVRGWTSVGISAEVTATGLSLTEGVTYYISVKARNSAGMWSVVGSSNGITTDFSPPTTPIVTDDGDYTSSTNSLHAAWSSSDPHSGVTEYQYAIGTTSGGSNLRGWTSVGTSTEVTATGLSLTEGVTYYISVKARNSADMWSVVGSSNGITTDFSPPSTPIVTDDGDYTSSTDSLHAAWSSSDPHSGVTEYQYCIGTTSGGSNVRGWTSVGTSTEVTATGLSLTEGVTYYISVKARNSADMWSVVGSSNGITTDFSPPSTPIVLDDGDTNSSMDSLHATWSATDPQSGISEYEYAIGTSQYETDVRDWTSAGSATEITANGLILVEGGTYYFSVKAKNGAGLWGGVGISDGIQVISYPAWPKFHYNEKNNGACSYVGSKLGAPLWQYDTAGWVESSPSLAGDGTTYFGSGDGKLYAISKYGNLSWSYETGGPIDSSPAIGEGGRIYFGSYDGYFYCLSPSGGLIWRFLTTDMIWSSPVIGPDGTIYFGCQDGYVYALNPNGTQKWRYNAGGSVWSSPALSDDGVLYFGANDACIHAVYSSNGTRKWKYLTATAVDSSPCIGPDGTIYAGSGDGYFYALNPDGTLKWKFLCGWAVDSTAAVGADGTIYVGTGHEWWSGSLYALYPNGTLKWSFDAHGEVRSSPAVDADGTIYFGSGDGNIYAVNQDGNLIWNYQTGLAILSSPAIGRDGRVCIGSYIGSVFTFKDSDLSDNTAPSIPVVTDSGVSTTSTICLSATWLASDLESGIDEYQYAIGTWPGTDDLKPWTSSGIATSVNCSDLNLSVGTTYYFSVKAKNGARLWSDVGVSNGIVVIESGDSLDIGEAKSREDQALVLMTGKVVIGSFEDSFYIEEQDRHAGIKVISNDGNIPLEGTLVTLVGVVTRDSGETAISLRALEIVGTSPQPEPLGIQNKVLGDSLNLGQPSGLDTTGLLVAVYGRITVSGIGYFLIDDGSAILDLSSGATGLRIRTLGSLASRIILPPAVGSYVRVVGVSSVVWTGDRFQRVVRPRKSSDITVYTSQ